VKLLADPTQSRPKRPISIIFQPFQFDNASASREPPTLLARADEVIE
jgi:hypothetical protein